VPNRQRHFLVRRRGQTLGKGLMGLRVISSRHSAAPNVTMPPRCPAWWSSSCRSSSLRWPTAPVVAAVSAVPANRSGLASGINNTARQTGTALGAAVFGAIAGGTAAPAAFVHGLHVLAGLGAAVWLAVALLVARTAGTPAAAASWTCNTWHLARAARPVSPLAGCTAVDPRPPKARLHPPPGEAGLHVPGRKPFGPAADQSDSASAPVPGRRRPSRGQHRGAIGHRVCSAPASFSMRGRTNSVISR
jgi:hypothetical protein